MTVLMQGWLCPACGKQDAQRAACKTCIREYALRYRTGNAEEEAARKKRYRAENLEKVSAGQKRWRVANAKKLSVYSAIYREENAESIEAYRKRPDVVMRKRESGRVNYRSRQSAKALLESNLAFLHMMEEFGHLLERKH